MAENITAVNTKIEAFNAVKAVTLTAADTTTDAGAQAFVYTPTGKDNHSVLLIQSASADVVTIGIPTGDGPFAGPALATATGAAAGITAIQLETGRYMKANGTITITFTAATDKDLKNDNALKVAVIEMLPN